MAKSPDRQQGWYVQPMTRRPLAPLLLVLAALAACASAQKTGDRAAATGDWKAAERAYADALRDDPGNPEAKARWETARAQALSTSIARGRACAGAQDWECAFAEADYASRLDGGSAELAVFRRDAGRSLADARLQRATEAWRRRDFLEGLQLLASARTVSDDAAIRAEAQRLQPSLVKGATDEAEAARRGAQYPRAIALLGAAAEADGAVRPRFEAVKAEYARALDAEAARFEKDGDALLAQHRFADAQASYEAAARARPDGRGATLARYAANLRAGEAAVQARDWGRATQAYQAAVALGVDPGGYAAGELEAVRVRRQAIQLRAVLVRPARPDGQPWVGERTRVFDAVMIGARAADRAFWSDDPSAYQTAIEVATGVPPENQPALAVVLDLAGRRLATAPRRALYLAPGASVVVAANRYDDRLLTVRVVQREAVEREVGVVQVRLGDLVSRGRVALRNGSIGRVELVASPTDAPDGSLSGLVAEGAVAGTAQPAPPKKK